MTEAVILLRQDRRTHVTGVIDLSVPFACRSSWAFVPSRGPHRTDTSWSIGCDRPAWRGLRCASVRRSSIRYGSRVHPEGLTYSQSFALAVDRAPLLPFPNTVATPVGSGTIRWAPPCAPPE